MSEELKPCPFCGDSNLTEIKGGEGQRAWSCDYCGADGPLVSTNDPEKAEKAWNRRPIEDALKAEIVRLQILVDRRANTYDPKGVNRRP